MSTIKLKRTKRDKSSIEDLQLNYGEPLFIQPENHLYIGDGNSTVKNLKYINQKDIEAVSNIANNKVSDVSVGNDGVTIYYNKNGQRIRAGTIQVSGVGVRVDSAKDVTSTIDGTKITDIFEPGNKIVKEARKAATAEYAKIAEESTVPGSIYKTYPQNFSVDGSTINYYLGGEKRQLNITTSVPGTVDSAKSIGGVEVATCDASFRPTTSGKSLGTTDYAWSNIYGTNLYGTNLYTTNIGSAESRVENIYCGNLNVKNSFTITNLYATNIGSSDNQINTVYASNIGSSSSQINNLYATNIGSSSSQINTVYASNIGTANKYVGNIYASKITGTNITGTYIKGSYITGTNITGSYITGTYFMGTYITGEHGNFPVNCRAGTYLGAFIDITGSVYAKSVGDTSKSIPTIYATSIVGDSSNFTNCQVVTLSGAFLTITGPSQIKTLEVENLTATETTKINNLTATGTVEIKNLTTSGNAQINNLTTTGNAEINNLTATGTINLNCIAASGAYRDIKITSSGISYKKAQSSVASLINWATIIQKCTEK